MIRSGTIVSIVLCLLYSAQAHAFDEIDQCASALAVVSAVDYFQSAALFSDRDRYEERNPLLSSHPSRQELFWFGASSVGLLYLSAKNIKPERGKLLLGSAIAIETINILWTAHRYRGYREIGVAAPVVTIVWRF